MMDLTRFIQALFGLRLILRLEPGGFSFFEKTYNGFVRSFFPAVLLSPFYFLHTGLSFGDENETLGMAPYFVVETLSYVLSWTIFPFVMIYVARSLDRSDRYFAYLVPYNWFQLTIGGLAMPLLLLIDIGWLDNAGGAFFNFVILGVLMVYGTFLARTALNVATTTALGIVFMDVLLNLLTNELIDKIYDVG